MTTPSFVAPPHAVPPTVAQALTTLLDDQDALDGRLGTALDRLAPGGLRDELSKATLRLAARRADARALGTFADVDVDEARYAMVARLYARLSLLDGLLAGPVPAALAGLPAAVGAHRTDLRTLCLRLLSAIERPKVPTHGWPSVGFEYQLSAVRVHTADLPAKTLVAQWPDDGSPPLVRLETDGGEAEFVTLPATTMDVVRQQLRIIRDELARISSAGRTGIVYLTPVPVMSAVDGRQLYPAGHPVRLAHTEGEIVGRVQATTACHLLDGPELIAMHANGVGLDAIDDDPHHGSSVALLRLVSYSIESLKRDARNDAQGPKVLLPVMSRTSLAAVYAALPPGDRAHFRTAIAYQVDGGLDGVRNDRLVPRGYRGPAGNPETGPTVGAWLDSIVDGSPSTVDTEPLDRDNDGTGPRGTGRDLMSPPPGYPAHRRGRHFTYAMGFYGLAADGALLFEVRELWSTGAYSFDRFELQAREFARQRFETSAARATRLRAVVRGLVDDVRRRHIAAHRQRANVVLSIKDQVAPAEVPIAVGFVDELLRTLPPPSDGRDRTVAGKRERDDDEDGTGDDRGGKEARTST